MSRCVSPWILSLLLLTSSTISSAERRERLIDEWRPIHYEVSLTLDEKLSEITSARTEITIQIVKASITAIDLDFGDMSVDSISVDGKPANYTRAPGKLNITLNREMKVDDRLQVSVAYHGRPKDGLILTPDKDGRPSVTGDNWPDRVHNWIPTLDHPSAKATVRFTITAPAQDLAVANGRLESTQSNANNTRTWIWNEGVPISPYCMVIVVGDYARFEATEQGSNPLYYYVPRSDGRFAMQGFAPSNPSLKFFSEIVGPYPYEKLALIVGATRYGGMENSSAIVFGSGLFKDFRTAQPRSRIYGIPNDVRDVVAHEIAHQWFGDSVTEATWADLWLSEGFATYFDGLFIERYEGKVQFQAYLKKITDKYLDYEKELRTPIFDKETEDLNALLNPNNYEKGAWVLHMLRGLVGDKAFFDGVRDYYVSHRNATATSEDLRASLEKTSGQDLKDFFASWIYGSGHPNYEVTWKFRPSSKSTQEGYVEVTVRQVQEGNEVFLIPFVLEVDVGKEKIRMTITPKGREALAEFQVSRQPTSVKLDPDNFVLKEVTIKRS